MHPCLLIPEVLQQIFSNFDLSGTEQNCFTRPDRRVARHSLAALCRVCRSFKDVALDVLWVELLNLQPLFTRLPQDLWHAPGDGTLVLRRPVTVRDWSVFERYASRVRVLRDDPEFQTDIFGGIDANFIHAIVILAPKALLVPNIREIYCGECRYDLHSCMRYLLGPDLVHLNLRPLAINKFWSDDMSSVISCLGRHSPRLKVVHLGHAPDQVGELALCGLSHLQEISLLLGSPRTFQVRTSTLAILSIRSPTLTLFGNLVQHWVVPCRRLDLFYFFPETALAVERALRELDNRVLCDGLEEFRCDGAARDDSIAYALSLHTFTPLMRFSSLKIVELPQFCTSLLDDDAIGSIAKSWPLLEHLELGTNHSSKNQPRMTFQGLVTVLSSCPSLRVLGLVFDATKVDPEKSGAGVCNTNITTLGVGFSPIEQTPEVAIALSAILPCLTEIKVEKRYTGLNREARAAKWREVSKSVGVYNLVRQREGLHHDFSTWCHTAETKRRVC